MNKELKKEIINFIFNNEREFQLHNATTTAFKEYIYTSKGQYLIGGKEVSEFIEQAIKLIHD